MNIPWLENGQARKKQVKWIGNSFWKSFEKRVNGPKKIEVDLEMDKKTDEKEKKGPKEKKNEDKCVEYTWYITSIYFVEAV